jgi:ribose transport system permease protein
MSDAGGRESGSWKHFLLRSWSAYATPLALLMVCAAFSLLTLTEQAPDAATAARQLADQAARVADGTPGAGVLVVVGNQAHEVALAAALERQLAERQLPLAGSSTGTPASARRLLEAQAELGQPLAAICVSKEAATWEVLARIDSRFPTLGQPPVLAPRNILWPTFLKTENLLNVASQISVIAIVAIGMTLVIITGGIDLSVGSLIALSAVIASLLIRDYGGGEQASGLAMVACSLAAIVVCAGSGLFSGVMITAVRIPPFIVTLAMMLVASGAAYTLARGESISAIPPGFVRLGRGADLAGIPNSVVLMLGLFAIAHVVMKHSVFGRAVYAVGGNAEAARLSGIAVAPTIVLCYVLSGALAGLGGVIVASQLRSGSPTYGQMDEMLVIAAVVVGGTSLSGGEGKVLGTLVGALLIAVIKNGMNLLGVESYTQKVVLGLVLLGAAVLDRWRARGS